MSFPGLQPGPLSTPAELNLRKGTDDSQSDLTDIGLCDLQTLFFKSGLSPAFLVPALLPFKSGVKLGGSRGSNGGSRGLWDFYQEGCARAVPSAVL